jgi:predicted FMN-binding regulatory protein PaiB
MEIPAKSAGSLDPIISEIQIEVFRQRMRYKNSDNKNSDEQCKVNKQITKNSKMNVINKLLQKKHCFLIKN